MIFHKVQDRINSNGIYFQDIYSVKATFKGEKIMKNKKEIELWDVKDMYEYGVKIYQIPKDMSENEDYKESAVKQIKRTLADHYYKPVKVDENDKHEKYQIPYDIAQFFVEELLYDYFMNPSPKVGKRRAERKETHRQRVLEDMEKKSLKEDNKITVSTGAAEIVHILYDEIETNPNYDPDGKMKEKIESSKWKSENFHKLSNDMDVPKKDLEYHIPDLSVDELDNETVERIIDRMMIRAVFDLFYDFKEKDFRMALYERAAHIEEINEGGVKPVSGYSELSRRLENPLGFYITKKDIVKKDATKKDTSKKE